MKVNLLHYKNEEIKYARGLHQIPEMIDARQFYMSGMKEMGQYSHIQDIARSMDVQGRNNRSSTTGGHQRYGSMRQTKRIDRYGNQKEGEFPKIKEQQPLER